MLYLPGVPPLYKNDIHKDDFFIPTTAQSLILQRKYPKYFPYINPLIS